MQSLLTLCFTWRQLVTLLSSCMVIIFIYLVWVSGRNNRAAEIKSSCWFLFLSIWIRFLSFMVSCLPRTWFPQRLHWILFARSQLLVPAELGHMLSLFLPDLPLFAEDLTNGSPEFSIKPFVIIIFLSLCRFFCNSPFTKVCHLTDRNKDRYKMK